MIRNFGIFLVILLFNSSVHAKNIELNQILQSSSALFDLDKGSEKITILLVKEKSAAQVIISTEKQPDKSLFAKWSVSGKKLCIKILPDQSTELLDSCLSVAKIEKIKNGYKLFGKNLVRGMGSYSVFPSFYVNVKIKELDSLLLHEYPKSLQKKLLKETIEGQKFASEKLKARLPMKIDKGITLVEVKSSGVNLNYIYKLINVSVGQIIDKKASEKLRKIVVKNVCDKQKRIITAGATYTYTYLSFEGKKLFDFHVNQYECGFI